MYYIQGSWRSWILFYIHRFCLLSRSVWKVTEYGGYKINRIHFAFSMFEYRNYIFRFFCSFLLFLLPPPSRCSVAFFWCVFISFTFLPPVLSCSSIILKLEVKSKKHGFLARNIWKSIIHQTLTWLQSKQIFMQQCLGNQALWYSRRV